MLNRPNLIFRYGSFENTSSTLSGFLFYFQLIYSIINSIMFLSRQTRCEKIRFYNVSLADGGVKRFDEGELTVDRAPVTSL